ncbi:very-long-chain (3R)-3-hydroxyacyl-CoA dehydratase 3 [Teleopsis dalmanni]|uniref:very-long-chain (3R)-3-hydroxyacyl-CoA dehydratase 3 n=1 Tax=Teleopsis dalmanni TaxID=139649 RepID=UPI0018CD26AC|nr:very-long-chain (3R)-3-hydroxyacyl-CoA dehydratase 3 [Teleopsis dalmanni]
MAKKTLNMNSYNDFDKNKGSVHSNSKADNLLDSSHAFSPLVYWAQTEQTLTLKVDLKDSKPPVVDFTPKSLSFSAEGYGARGFNTYKFDLSFYALINDENCTCRVFDNKIEFYMQKCEKGWWPRLIGTPQKPHWLKIDFDRWRVEDDFFDEQPRDVIEDYTQEFQKLQKDELGYIKESSKKVYMILYNLVQFVGFLYILCVMTVLYYRDGPSCMTKIYESVGSAMKFCQLLQYLEVLHPIFGYTKGSPLVPFFQVSGRNFVLFIMIEMEERMQTKPVVFYIFVIWAVIEVIRYPYYITQLVRHETTILTWLRYTIWIPLYPMGILCEGIIILRNIPYFEETNRFSLQMPNKWNITFNMPLFMKLYLLLLILPGTYLLMSHMTKIRAKKLSNKTHSRR